LILVCEITVRYIVTHDKICSQTDQLLDNSLGLTELVASQEEVGHERTSTHLIILWYEEREVNKSTQTSSNYLRRINPSLS